MTDSLQQFIEKVTGESHLRVEQDLGDGFVRLRSEEAERRQAKHDVRKSEDIVIEMLRNSRDAQAKRIYIASWKEDEVRNITIVDDGCGLPESMYSRIFEARVTSKLDTMRMDLWGVHGRGMALYAIKTNADKAEVVCSKLQGGTSIHVEASTTKLGEKRDQSTFPIFSKDETGTITVRGPKNINRTVLEFAYIERRDCDVFYGSAAEIASALWLHAKDKLTQTAMVFSHDPEEFDVCDRLALAATPEEFSLIAESLGLPLSARTARRIMNGEISPAIDAFKKISSPTRTERVGKNDIQSGISAFDRLCRKETATVHLSEENRDRFCESIKTAFKELARAYYLESDVVIEMKMNKGKLTISIPIEPLL